MSYPQNIQVQNFDRVYKSWQCALAHVLVRTVAVRGDDGWCLLSSVIDLLPISNDSMPLGVVETETLRVAAEMYNMTTAELETFVAQARRGSIHISGDVMTLPGKQISEYAQAPFPVHQYTIPQLDIRGEHAQGVLQAFNYERALADLRSSSVPFDGFADVLSLFGFGSRDYLPTDASIVLKLHPPVNIVLEGTSLTQNKLNVRLLRKAEFPVKDISVGLRVLPNSSMLRRLQIANRAAWSKGENGLEYGVIEVELEDCTAAVVMITAAGQSVRQWFVADPAKSLNPRLQDYRAFDPKLENLNKALRVTKGDSRSLEAAVATLLHLHGANAITPPSTDAPDILAETPKRKAIVAECTIAFNDLHDKVGKLAGRRDALIRHHANVGVQKEVLAVLVINAHPQLTPGDTTYLIEQQIALVTLADLETAVHSLELPFNLDDLFDAKVEQLRQQLVGMHGSIGVITP